VGSNLQCRRGRFLWAGYFLTWFSLPSGYYPSFTPPTLHATLAEDPIPTYRSELIAVRVGPSEMPGIREANILSNKLSPDWGVARPGNRNRMLKSWDTSQRTDEIAAETTAVQVGLAGASYAGVTHNHQLLK
jgi:hypothetical protein